MNQEQKDRLSFVIDKLLDKCDITDTQFKKTMRSRNYPQLRAGNVNLFEIIKLSEIFGIPEQYFINIIKGVENGNSPEAPQ